MGRNPKTGEAIQIKAKRVVKFRVAKAAKDAILGSEVIFGFQQGASTCRSAFFISLNRTAWLAI